LLLRNGAHNVDIGVATPRATRITNWTKKGGLQSSQLKAGKDLSPDAVRDLSLHYWCQCA
jgi:hypothetical protein